MNTITEGTYSADFVYNADDARAKMTVKNNNVAFLTRTYIGGSYIKESLNGVEKDYTFVGGDAYSAPVVIESSGTTKTPYFLLRDYLGNITHVANNSGSLIYEYSYDAWGRQRNPNDWTNYAVGSEPDLYMGRGFTGHEHLPWFNLINMNGRLYDPVVGRMLSPDPYVQMPDYTQSYNRYSYCLNNPLAFTDPTGNTWFGSVFRWGGNAFDNLGDFLTHNNIQFGIGYSTNTGNPWRGTPYAYGNTPNGTNVGVGYNMSTGNVGIGNNSSGFTNFYYPGYNFERADQIGEMAVAEGRVKVQCASADHVYGAGNVYLGGKINNYGGVKGLTVYTFYGYHDDYRGGVVINLDYTGSNANGAQWKQRIYTDHPAEGKTSPYWDGDNGSQYYYSGDEMKAQTNGKTVSFSDTPYRGQKDASWRGILSLYNGNNHVLSLYYGFRVNNYITTPYPIHVLYP